MAGVGSGETAAPGPGRAGRTALPVEHAVGCRLRWLDERVYEMP
jgi:hypothetical protein